MIYRSSSINPLAITAYSTLNACGVGTHALLHALQNNQSFLKPLTLFEVKFPTVVGEITQELTNISPELIAYQSRNAKAALTTLNYQPDGLRAAIETAKACYGAHRIGVVIGTSTSGLYETESAYRFLRQHGEMPEDFHFLTCHAYQATGRFLQLELGLTGICFAISTACSSGAKAIAAGQRLINNNLCDAVLVGGVDTLCRLTLRGFNSLELVSPTPCTPMDKNRTGISIGEAAGLLLLEKISAENQQCSRLLAVGESSDAHHMSHPHPEGLGAVLAMQRALNAAGIHANEVDYLNLHATATKINDAVENKAVYAVFKNHVPSSGTKGITGHTLGAAGALETIIALQALEHQFIPATTGLSQIDDDCNCHIVKKPIFNQKLNIAMSNSFGFGGNNASVIVAKSGVDLPGFKNLEGLEQSLFIKSVVICCPDSSVLKPFGLESIEVDKSLIPATMRRRTSLTTRMAITAATQACIAAHVDPSLLPSVFASLGGEIQVTDVLCRALSMPDELLSPTHFHNSVHNTTAGYWGILNHCQAPTTAIAAADDNFAMGLLEAASQLQQGEEDILLVCYDEEWPQYLSAPLGAVAFACALVLSRNQNANAKMPALSIPHIATPEQSLDLAWCDLVKTAPAAAAIPLLQALKNQRAGLIPLNIHSAIWHTQLQI
jgi:3-oxoacyl-[acyl-carrier-protein] synthase-1